MIKKAIAVMTSGGDSPGMNAAARAEFVLPCMREWMFMESTTAMLA